MKVSSETVLKRLVLLLVTKQTSHPGWSCHNGLYQHVGAHLPTVAWALTFALQLLHAAAAASGNAYWCLPFRLLAIHWMQGCRTD